MTSCNHEHQGHSHVHGEGCGHQRIKHENHFDYLHDGHLHNVHGNHVDEHVVKVSNEQPEHCTNGHECQSHADDHVHGPNCGHAQVPHGDHTDYLVDGHLHHQHDGHCDHHGKIYLS